MVLNWLARDADVNELIAKRRYSKAIQILTSEYRQGRRDPRLRLQLADVLVMAGRRREAVPVLRSLADEFAVEGFAAKAISVLKKVQRIDPRPDVERKLASLIKQKGEVGSTRAVSAPAATSTMPEFGIEEIGPASSTPEFGIEEIGIEPIEEAAAAPPPAPPPATRAAAPAARRPAEKAQPAPRKRPVAPAAPPARTTVVKLSPPAAEPPASPPAAPGAAPAPVPAPAPPPAPATAQGRGGEPEWESLTDELLDVIQVVLTETTPHPGVASVETPAGREVGESPLFDDFSGEELAAVIGGLELKSYDAGDVIITQGEAGSSLFVLTSGVAKAFVRDESGRSRLVREMEEGAFFGEISILSGQPRTATVTAKTSCELLELNRGQLDEITATHPRVLEVLQQFYEQRVRNQPD